MESLEGDGIQTELLRAMLSEQDDQGRPVAFNRVAGVVVPRLVTLDRARDGLEPRRGGPRARHHADPGPAELAMTGKRRVTAGAR